MFVHFITTRDSIEVDVYCYTPGVKKIEPHVSGIKKPGIKIVPKKLNNS